MPSQRTDGCHKRVENKPRPRATMWRWDHRDGIKKQTRMRKITYQQRANYRRAPRSLSRLKTTGDPLITARSRAVRADFPSTAFRRADLAAE